MRLWRIALALTIPLTLLPSATRAEEQPPSRVPVLTREHVLTGAATREERLELIMRSFELAGGIRFDRSQDEEDPVPAEALGGSAHLLAAMDLAGDGRQEVLAVQYASGRTHLVALDGAGVLWRHRLQQDSWLYGGLEADFAPAAGREFVLLAHRFPTGFFLVGIGADGPIWSADLGTSYFEVNGAVQADDDNQDELAISYWRALNAARVRTIDGASGRTLNEVRSSIDPTGALGATAVQGFVTDGAAGQPDEAVFITPLAVVTPNGRGYVAERRRLTDGQQLALEVVADEMPRLYQGIDHTGDGRRDAYQFDIDYEEVLAGTASLGIFDGVAMETAWTRTVGGPDPESYQYALPVGDADGDGSSDVCAAIYADRDEGRTSTATTTLRCFSGRSGAELWQASRSVTSEQAWSYPMVHWHDLNGDGLVDPIAPLASSICSPDDCVVTEELTALSGKDGAPLWTLQGLDESMAFYRVEGDDLDDSPGDDALAPDDASTEPTGFRILNGRTLDASWRGRVDTRSLEGVAQAATAADLDGNGDGEVVIVASAEEPVGEPVCDSEDECYYRTYRQHVSVAAFEPGGRLLWQRSL